MLPAAMAFAAAFVMLSMMIAPHIGIIIQLSVQKRFYRRVRVSGYSAVQLDSCGCQRILRPCSDTAADQRLHLMLF